MKPFVGIGITTYLDISSTERGAAIYDAYNAHAPTLAPDHVRIRSVRYPVCTAADFASYWRADGTFELRENRGRGPIVEKGNLIVGAEWMRPGRGGGKVIFRPELQNDRPDAVVIKHPYSSQCDWSGLFSRLVDICEPAYAMLHLFTEEEIGGPQGDRFERFDGPFAGEEHFTSWKSSLGEWRKPDRWEVEERRRYRHLPSLSWANFLGPEFEGQFDKDHLAKHAAHCRAGRAGILFSVTNVIDDVINESDHFASSKLSISAAFRNGFFRRA